MTITEALLVEDESPKLTHIRDFMRDSFPWVGVRDARSVSSAIEAVDGRKFDLLLLDMSLPTFDVGQGETGGQPQGFGGREILRHVKMSNLDLQTIVLTGYEAFPNMEGNFMDLDTLRGELVKEFPSTVRDVVHFSSTLEGWEKALADAVSAILEGNGNG